MLCLNWKYSFQPFSQSHHYRFSPPALQTLSSLCDPLGWFNHDRNPTCSGCSLWRVCLSAARSHRAGAAKPVSDSLMPVSSFTRLLTAVMSSSTCLIDLLYCPWPCWEDCLYLSQSKQRPGLITHVLYNEVNGFWHDKGQACSKHAHKVNKMVTMENGQDLCYTHICFEESNITFIQGCKQITL